MVPQRTDGGARRYSLRDIARLAKAQQLSQEEGINLAGIARILSLEEENRELRRQVERLRKPAGSSVFAADADGDIVEIERSRRARMWRRQIQVNARQLPSRDFVESARAAADAYDTPNGVSYVKTRVFRGVNPPLSPFPGQSCFGGLTDFRKILKILIKQAYLATDVPVLLYNFAKCITFCDDVVVVGNNVEYPHSDCHSSGH